MNKIPESLFMGPFKEPMIVAYSDSVKQIGLAFTPLGFYTFFDKIPNFFNEMAMDISNVEMFYDLNHMIYALFIDHDEGSEEINRIIDQIEAYFLETLNHKDISLEIGEMMSYINSHEGQIDVTQMAAYFSYSVSGLKRRFKKYFFMSPKAYSNIIKFRFAMADETPQSYFYDQAHFIKNVKKYTTLNPGELSETDALTLLQMLE
ncbi:MAG: hypothetical protein JXR88_02525 [Clostridia bacterium]|nr:hypothetical protein [Clostridia bacterium]